KIVETTLLDRQRPVDIGLRHKQPGAQQEPPMQGGVMQTHRRRGPGRALKDMASAVGVDDLQPADADQPREYGIEQHRTILSSKWRGTDRPEPPICPRAAARQQAGRRRLDTSRAGPRNAAAGLLTH